MERLLLCALKYPGSRQLIVRKTAISLTNTAMVTWERFVAEQHLKYGVCRWYGGSGKEAAGYRFQNGSVINIGGMDKPDRIMSSEYDQVFAQEAVELTQTDWQAITTRLRNGVMPYQSLIADCNPSYPDHWLKQRCDSGTTVMLETRHEDNPRYFDDHGNLTEEGAKYLRRLDALVGVQKQRLRYGLWIAAEGVVYEEWDPNVHVVPDRRLPDDWPRYWSIDFGMRNPFVCQCWAEAPDGQLVLEWELYRTGLLVEDACRILAHHVMVEPAKEVDSPWKGTWRLPKPAAVIADHDAEDRATFERHMGLYTTAANKAVTTGIQEMQARLRPTDSGAPGLVVLNRPPLGGADSTLEDSGRPTSTASEVLRYVWDTREGRAPRELPVKEHDHGMDAARYVCMHRQLGANIPGSFYLPGSGSAAGRAKAKAEARMKMKERAAA